MFHIDKKTTLAFFLAFGLLVMPGAGMSAASETQAIKALSHNKKLIRPDSVLAPFYEGEKTVRVIVTLSPPVTLPKSGSLETMNDRARRRRDVGAFLERVKPGFSSSIELTNEFQYQFGFSARVTFEGLAELLKRDDVQAVEEDGIETPHLAQGIPLMNAGTVRGDYPGSGVSVAVSDTGIDYTHPMLGDGGFPNSKVIGGYDSGDDDYDPMDRHGHGTSVAGIAAGDTGTTGDYIGGVASGAKLYALKISHGTGGSAYTSDVIEAWEWCITHQNDNPSHPILIINHSFGGSRYTGVCDASESAYFTAADNVVSAGIAIFASSGNDGSCTAIARPACVSPVISVGAVFDAAFGSAAFCVSEDSCATIYTYPYCDTGYAATDDTAADLVASYSNTADFLDLLAPSNNAYTTDIVGAGGGSSGDYRDDFGGTSAAAPYAAGAGAVLQNWYKAVNGDWAAPEQLKSLLASSGDRVTDPKTGTSFPRVNVGTAVNGRSPDIVWRNTSGGSGVWLMDGLTESSWEYIGNHGESWDIKGLGDFNADGYNDLLWRNASTGGYGVWFMNGVNEASWRYIGNNGIDWDIRGVGDFNHDGHNDIVWRNGANGNYGVWLMDGAEPSSWASVGGHGLSWDIKGVGDFNGDGDTDLIWRNESTGNAGLWSMDGLTESSWIYIANHGLSWDIKGVDDFNRDGQNDIVWRNSAGNFGVWYMNGVSESSWNYMGNHGASWDVKSVGEMK